MVPLFCHMILYNHLYIQLEDEHIYIDNQQVFANNDDIDKTHDKHQSIDYAKLYFYKEVLMQRLCSYEQFFGHNNLIFCFDYNHWPSSDTFI